MSHECNTCHKTFTRKASLINHKNKNICDEYNKLPYKCTHCSKKYLSQKSLSVHERNKHSLNNNKKYNEKKKIKCLLCNNKFSRNSNLKKHLSLHRCPGLKNKGTNKSTNNISITNNCKYIYRER